MNLFFIFRTLSEMCSISIPNDCLLESATAAYWCVCEMDMLRFVFVSRGLPVWV